MREDPCSQLACTQGPTQAYAAAELPPDPGGASSQKLICRAVRLLAHSPLLSGLFTVTVVHDLESHQATSAAENESRLASSFFRTLEVQRGELPVAKTPLGTHFSYPSWLRERGQDMPLQRRGSSVVGIAHGHGYPLAHLPVQEQERRIDGLRHPGPCRLDQVPQRLEQDLRIRNALLALCRNPFLLRTLLCHSRRLPHLLPKSRGG